MATWYGSYCCSAELEMGAFAPVLMRNLDGALVKVSLRCTCCGNPALMVRMDRKPYEPEWKRRNRGKREACAQRDAAQGWVSQGAGI